MRIYKSGYADEWQGALQNSSNVEAGVSSMPDTSQNLAKFNSLSLLVPLNNISNFLKGGRFMPFSPQIQW